jgi:hypothetical protein
VALRAVGAAACSWCGRVTFFSVDEREKRIDPYRLIVGACVRIRKEKVFAWTPPNLVGACVRVNCRSLPRSTGRSEPARRDAPHLELYSFIWLQGSNDNVCLVHSSSSIDSISILRVSRRLFFSSSLSFCLPSTPI